MTTYLIRRVGLALGVLWAAFTLSFVVLYLIPGDAVSTMAGGGLENEPVSAEELDRLQAQYGFDEPLPVQYVERLWAALHGDFGSSVQSGQRVTTAIGQALPATLQLASAALVIALVVGVGTALVATYTRVRWLKSLLLSLPALGVSLPTFWVGLMLVQVLSFQLRLLPAFGNDASGALVLPAVTLAIPTAAVVAQVLAKCLGQALEEPYVVTARAKGVGRVAIHLRHVLQNAAIPTLTIAGVLVGNLLAGSVVVETVFSRTGLGRLTVTAVTYQDIPLVQGIVVFGAVVFVGVNLLVDLVYPLLDPRIAVGASHA